jgi:enoyl-CoA hydratase/carnithine racemase
MAGGMGVMGMCDMVVATPQAIFGLPEVKVGLFPAQVLSVLNGLLPAACWPRCASRASRSPPQGALSYGLINYVATTWTPVSTGCWIACSTNPRPPSGRGLYTDEAHRGDGVRGVDVLHRKPDRPVRADRRRSRGPTGLPREAQTGLDRNSKCGAARLHSFATTPVAALVRTAFAGLACSAHACQRSRRPAMSTKSCASAAPRASGATAASARRSWWPAGRSTTWCSTTWPS